MDILRVWSPKNVVVMRESEWPEFTDLPESLSARGKVTDLSVYMLGHAKKEVEKERRE